MVESNGGRVGHDVVDDDDYRHQIEQLNRSKDPGANSVAVQVQRAAPAVLSAPVSVWELLLGLLALITWFALFGGGILFGTEPYRQVLEQDTGLWNKLSAGLVVFTFWTITNVGLLACVAAFLGAFGRRTRFVIHVGSAGEPYPDSLPREVPLHYASAVIRGFGIYGIMLAGLLVLATKAFEAPGQGEYLRLAATVSVLSFYAGYDPEMFAGVLLRVKRLMDDGSGGKSAVIVKTDGPSEGAGPPAAKPVESRSAKPGGNGK